MIFKPNIVPLILVIVLLHIVVFHLIHSVNQSFPCLIQASRALFSTLYFLRT
jgi:hypothetical protein